MSTVQNSFVGSGLSRSVKDVARWCSLHAPHPNSGNATLYPMVCHNAEQPERHCHSHASTNSPSSYFYGENLSGLPLTRSSGRLVLGKQQERSLCLFEARRLFTSTPVEKADERVNRKKVASENGNDLDRGETSDWKSSSEFGDLSGNSEIEEEKKFEGINSQSSGDSTDQRTSGGHHKSRAAKLLMFAALQIVPLSVGVIWLVLYSNRRVEEEFRYQEMLKLGRKRDEDGSDDTNQEQKRKLLLMAEIKNVRLFNILNRFFVYLCAVYHFHVPFSACLDPVQSIDPIRTGCAVCQYKL